MPPAKSRKKAKKKAASKKRKLNARVAAQPAPFLIPLTWFKTFLGILLLPICYLTTTTFLGVFAGESTARALIHSAPLWFFCTGVVVWVIAFVGFPRPVYIYVLGHELTHALFIRMLTGGASPREVLTSDEISLDGSLLDTIRFFSLIRPARGNFPIVTP